MDSFTMFQFEDELSHQCRKRRGDGKGVVNRLQLIVELIQSAAQRYEEIEVNLDDEKAAFSTPEFTECDLDLARKICEYRNPHESFAEPTRDELEKTLPIRPPFISGEPVKFLDNINYNIPKENYEASVPFTEGEEFFSPAYEKEDCITAKKAGYEIGYTDEICNKTQPQSTIIPHRVSKPRPKPATNSSRVPTTLPKPALTKEQQKLIAAKIAESIKLTASCLPTFRSKAKPLKPPKPAVLPPQRKLSPDVKLAQILPNSMLKKDFIYSPTTSLSSTFDFSKYDRKAHVKAFPDLLRKSTLAQVFPRSAAFPE